MDGIQFDYVRYPDKHPFYGWTRINVERFKKATGRRLFSESDRVWKDWKREQVTDLLRLLTAKAHSIKPGIQISTTGCSPYVRAYHEAFQDWPLWIKTGLVDFVTVMTYSPEPEVYEKSVWEAKNKVGDFKKVNIGVGAYKLVDTPGAFEEEFRFCEKTECGECVVFHYGSLCQNKALARPLTEKTSHGV